MHFLLTGTDDPSVEVTVEPFATIIDKCTEQNPNKRFASFNQLKLALEGIVIKRRGFVLILLAIKKLQRMFDTVHIAERSK